MTQFGVDRAHYTRSSAIDDSTAALGRRRPGDCRCSGDGRLFESAKGSGRVHRVPCFQYEATKALAAARQLHRLLPWTGEFFFSLCNYLLSRIIWYFMYRCDF